MTTIDDLQRQINALRARMFKDRYLEGPIKIKNGIVYLDAETRIGGAEGSNYVKIATDGTLTLVGTATAFADANVGSLVLQTGGTLPGIVEWLDDEGDATGIYTRGFAINEQGSGSIEIPHDYKEGSDIVPHVHWGGNDAPADNNRGVKWQLTYSITRGGSKFPDSTAIVIETKYSTQYKLMRSDFPTITGTSLLIGDQFNFALKRIAVGTLEEYGGEALVETIGFHYEIDAIGSSAITTK